MRRFPLILALIAICSICASAQLRNDISPIKQIEPAKWWIVPIISRTTQEGRLYFGSLLENQSNKRLLLVITFRAYKADGTLFDACSDGVSVDIAPHEKALAICNKSIVPGSTKDLQITSRIIKLKPIVVSPLNATVIESGITTKESDAEVSIYEAFALVRAQGNRDIETALLFRFYDDNDIQIETKYSQSIILEPEVAQKVTSFSLIVDAGSPQPKRVRIDTQGYAGN